MKDDIIKLSWESTERVIFPVWLSCFLMLWLVCSMPASSSVTCRFPVAGWLRKQLVHAISLTLWRLVHGDVFGFAVGFG